MGHSILSLNPSLPSNPFTQESLKPRSLLCDCGGGRGRGRGPPPSLNSFPQSGILHLTGSGLRMGNSQATQNESESESESTTMELTPPPPSPLLDDASAKEVLAILEEFDSIPNLEELATRAKPIQPPPHIVEAMVLRGDFDLDLADPDLAPLFEDPPES